MMSLALLACFLTACSNDKSSNSAITAPSTTEKKTVESDFFSVTLPAGINETDTPYVFADNQHNISLFVSVYDVPASEQLSIELLNSDFSKGESVKANGTNYKVAESKETQQAYYITDWENGCIEVGVNGKIEDKELIKEFLEGLTFETDAYAKWQAAPKDQVQDPGQIQNQTQNQSQDQTQNQNQNQAQE